MHEVVADVAARCRVLGHGGGGGGGGKEDRMCGSRIGKCYTRFGKTNRCHTYVTQDVGTKSLGYTRSRPWKANRYVTQDLVNKLLGNTRRGKQTSTLHITWGNKSLCYTRCRKQISMLHKIWEANRYVTRDVRKNNVTRYVTQDVGNELLWYTVCGKQNRCVTQDVKNKTLCYTTCGNHMAMTKYLGQESLCYTRLRETDRYATQKRVKQNR